MQTGQQNWGGRRDGGHTGERQWTRHAVQRPARLVSLESWLGTVRFRACRLMDISRGGASVFITTTIGLPDHYYLNIIGFSDRIGCAETYRNGNRVGMKFIKILEEHQLKMILDTGTIRV